MAIDQNFLLKMKELLLIEKSRLLKDIALLSHPTSSQAHEVVVENLGNEEGDSTVEAEQYIDSFGVEKTLEQDLQRIEGALARIENGSYGVCEICGKAISEERLMVMPSATTCVHHE